MTNTMSERERERERERESNASGRKKKQFLRKKAIPQKKSNSSEKKQFLRGKQSNASEDQFSIKTLLSKRLCFSRGSLSLSQKSNVSFLLRHSF